LYKKNKRGYFEMQKQEILTKLAEYVRLTWDRSLTESTGGNMSVRIGDKIYITPTFFYS
jgi:L-fuculose-phosphate aldolase